MSAETDRARSEPGAIVATLELAADGRRIFELHLNRPHKRNALTLAMLEELHRCLSEKADAIVLTSAGPSFCAGLDLDECRNESAWPRPIRHLESLASVYRGLLSSPATIIAIVQGFAVGGGVGLAACADVVIAAGDAHLRLPQGELASLARIVQPIIEARQIARFGKAVWLAGDLEVLGARSVGLVDEILEPEAFARLRESIWRDGSALSKMRSSWRQPDSGRTIVEAIRAIVTELSRGV